MKIAKTITMLDLRLKAASILNEVRKGHHFLLTYRGRPVVRLEPVAENRDIEEADPIYRLGELAVDKGESLSNAQIDRIVYAASDIH